MNRFIYAVGLSFALCTVAFAQVSHAADIFIQKFSYASTLVQEIQARSLRQDDLGKTILSLARTDDATLTEAFKLLDKNKSYQRTTVGDLLLILIYEIPDKGLSPSQVEMILDVLHQPFAGVAAPTQLWPWKNNNDGTWGLGSFSTRPSQIDTLTERLNFFQKQWPRRKFKDEPVYEPIKPAKPL